DEPRVLRQAPCRRARGRPNSRTGGRGRVNRQTCNSDFGEEVTVVAEGGQTSQLPRYGVWDESRASSDTAVSAARRDSATFPHQNALMVPTGTDLPSVAPKARAAS